eukprot:COSAG06_NODE_130_length_22547_cov_24.796418_4_plen_132_part_00
MAKKSKKASEKWSGGVVRIDTADKQRLILKPQQQHNLSMAPNRAGAGRITSASITLAGQVLPQPAYNIDAKSGLIIRPWSDWQNFLKTRLPVWCYRCGDVVTRGIALHDLTFDVLENDITFTVRNGEVQHL